MSSMKKETDFVRGKSINQTIGSKQKSFNFNNSLNDDQLFTVRKRKNFDNRREVNPKKVKTKKKTNEDNSEDSDRVFIEAMSLPRLPEGIVIYGCIERISNFDIWFCICGGIRAKVPITNISDSYTRLLQSLAQNESTSEDIEVLKPNAMFRIGQYFPIKIISKSKNEKNFTISDITASMNPRDIYSDLISKALLRVPQMPIIAAVDSIEDHGFVMDTGFEGIKAFLPKLKAQNAIQLLKDRDSLSVGQILLTAIDSVVNARSLTLTTKAKTLSKFKLTPNKEVSVSCLTPGVTVSATVMNITDRGLELNILNDFKGFVTRNHLKNDWDLPKNMYKIGDQIEGTILYRHPITKQIALSLKPKLDPKAVQSLLKNVKIGTIYENAVVMGRDDSGNMVFRLPNDMKAIAPKKHLFDTETDSDLDTMFSIGSKHKCRVNAINLMDLLVVVTLRKSLLETPTISIDDLKIGSLIKGTVKKLTKHGVVVEIGFGLRGFVPNIHLAETAQITQRQQLFPNEKRVKCRVFKMDKTCIPSKVSLTCKKSLLSNKLKILSSYEDIEPGFETDGVVVFIKPKGIVVEFFNDIKGFIPLKFLSTYRIEYPEQVFKIGQIVKCSVVSSDAQKDRIICSLIKIKDKNLMNNKNLRIGDLLTKMKIINKSENGFQLTNESKCKVFLPFGHLSDDVQLCTLLSETFSVDDLIEEVMVFTIKANFVIVSRKPTFINAIKNNNLISSIEELEPNLIVPVVINGFASYGIFVEMAGGVRGLVPKRYMIDGPIDEPNRLGFQLQQTVFVSFIEFEEQNEEISEQNVRKKITFSLKLSHVWSHGFEERVFLFSNYIKDFDLLTNLMQRTEDKPKLSNFKIGKIVFYRVIEINDTEVICDVRLENDKNENSVKGIAIKDEIDLEKGLIIGSSGNAVVVNIDFDDKSVEILIRHKTVKQVKNSLKINAISFIKCEQIIKCTAIYICKQYVLVTLNGHAPGVIAYIPAKRHPNDLTGISSLFTLHEFYHVIIKSIVDNKVIAVLKSDFDKHLSKVSVNSLKLMRLSVNFTEKTENGVKRKLSESEDLNDKKILEIYDNISNENKDKVLKIDNKKNIKENSKSNDNKSNIKVKENNRKKERNKKFKPEVLKVDQPFLWEVEEATPDLNKMSSLQNNQLSTESESEGTDSEEKNVKKKTRRERNEESRQREALIRKKEELIMDTERTPETIDDFERSVLASPNSSLVWLKYKAYHLEQTEISKARDVAERALKTISFREEKEKLNIWFAFLNLENLYGTQTSLEEVFQRAVQFNDPVVVYNHLANVYSQSNKLELTEALFNTMTKKFKQNKNVWINFGLFYMNNKRFESARKLMQRSLTCLEKRDHIEVISKFAQMEFKSGDVEHGKTLFENILANFPKRVDLWSVYIDMMLKYVIKEDDKQSEDSVRSIFERVITLKLAAKQMKNIFKRYIDFEIKFNNEHRIERIRQKALEYVEGKTIS